jgi:CubicO group peptidase (beta-lactamase class C family)
MSTRRSTGGRHRLPARIASLVGLFLFAGSMASEACKLPENRPFQQLAKELPLYDTKAFVSRVRQQMGDHFMGYVVAIQDRQGQVIAAVNYGWARTPCAPDGALAFSSNVQAAWGSVTKVVTATAVMRKVEKNPTRRSLDDPVVDYLPPAWKSEVSEPYRTVTIGQLIQHRSGFKRNAPTVGGKKLSVRQRLAQDPPEREIGGSRKYSNINFALFDWMPKFLRRTASIQEPPASASDTEYDEDYRAQGARSHERHLRDQIFEPLGIEMSCNHAEHAGNSYARNYIGPNATGQGYLVNRKDEPGCAVGGLILSPAGMLAFLYALSRTDQIVNRDTWALMARPGDERYGWPQVVQVRQDRSLGGQYNHGLAFGHDGSRWGGKAKGQVYIFPNGMSAVAVVNSKGSAGAPSLSDVLLEAYDALIPKAPRRSRN